MEAHYSWMPSLAADGQRRPPSAVDDWTKDRSTTPSATPGASTSNSLDINDLISDIGAAPSGSPTSSFYNFPQPQYYVQSQPGPFNTMPYGSSSWSTTSLPLSSYSSLKGATTSGHQVLSSANSPINESAMVIDPALTSMNNASPSTNKMQQQQHHTSQTATTSPYPYSTYSSLSVSPSYISYYPQSQTQQQQQSTSHSPPSQGTLSPQALHASSPPSSSLLSTIASSQFYGSPPQIQQPQQQPPPQAQLTQHSMASGSGSQPQISQGPTPEQRKQQLQTSIKPLLQSAAFTGAQAVNTLVQRIENFGIQDVDASLRLEILTKIRDGAGNHYFRAWGENPGAMDITREWLKVGYTAKEGDPLAETTMPLLHIIDRLPLSVESLKNSKLGKVVVKIVKDPPTPAIKDMASNVERRWRQLVEGASKTGQTTNGTSSNNVPVPAKKRKLSEPAKVPPAKKAAVGSSKLAATSATPSTAKSTSGPPVKDAKSDSSFFSAPKPKPRLPTFKKAPPPPIKKEPTAEQLDTNVAQPSSIDPFQEVLKSMGKARTQSPVTTATPPTSTPTPTASTGLTKSKKKKTVTWAAEGKLESIKLIERAVYDDDPAGDGMHHHNSLRDLERGEGAALHAYLFEETLDWSEPILIEIPADIEYVSRGEASHEKAVQEQREQTALVAIYLSDAHIPESPGEPTNVVDADEAGKDVVMMTCGPDVDEEFFSGEQQLPPNFATVADLVAQLATGNPGMGMSGMNNNVGVGDNAGMANGSDSTNGHGDPMAAFQQLQSLSQEQVQMLLQHINPTALGLGGQPHAGDLLAGDGPGPGNYSEYGYHDEGGSDRPWADTNSGVGGRGRSRGRGRGRGGRGSEGGFRHSTRKPCSFFQSGRCKYGDQCDFAHELVS